MKTRIKNLFIALVIFSVLSAALTTRAQGTAFTYQGRLNNSGSPASGSFDLTFSLFTTNASGVAIAGPVTNSATAVTNGLFTTTIDFGAGVFTGGSNWLQIAVRSNGVGSFNTLAPRQQVTPTPYAIFSSTAGNVNGLTIQPNAASGAPNTIGGSGVNFVYLGVIGATIGGGGATNYGGASFTNMVLNNFGTIGGGIQNAVYGNAATVGGGAYNFASGQESTVAGGRGNQALGNGSFVGGGGYDGINPPSGNIALNRVTISTGSKHEAVQYGGASRLNP